MNPRILVIKLGALGDFLFAVGPMQAIRRHHRDADLVLLTRPAYRPLAAASGLFDEIWDDPAPRLNPVRMAGLCPRLRHGRFERVYDLQTSDRSAAYFRLFWPGPVPEWSGKVAGASHRHVYRSRTPRIRWTASAHSWPWPGSTKCRWRTCHSWMATCPTWPRS